MNYQQIKKHEEYKKLCIASYKPFDAEDTDGYNLITAIPARNGFFACVYKKENEMVIVFRGSNDKKDWLDNNIPMVLKQLPDQTKNALEVYDRFSQMCRENGMKLTVVGHSLGGSLAAIVSAMRGVKAVTFNAYGVKQLLNPNIKYFTNNVINYCNEHDLITKSRAKDHIGECYKINSKNIFKSPHSLENMESLENREEVYGPYLQDQYEKEKRSQKEYDEYKKYGKHIIQMPSLHSSNNDSNCTGSYMVSGYIRDDGTKVSGYRRNCYIHGDKH